MGSVLLTPPNWGLGHAMRDIPAMPVTEVNIRRLYDNRLAGYLE